MATTDPAGDEDEGAELGVTARADAREYGDRGCCGEEGGAPGRALRPGGATPGDERPGGGEGGGERKRVRLDVVDAVAREPRPHCSDCEGDAQP